MRWVAHLSVRVALFCRASGAGRVFLHFVRGKGFCDETDYHFELSNDGEILKAIPNNQGRNKHWLQEDSEQCKNCIYGFNVISKTEDSAQRHFLHLYSGNIFDDLSE